MNDRPTARELLEAVGRFLREDAVGALDGHLRYQARVAANVVAIVAREIDTAEEQLDAEWRRLDGLLGDCAPPPTRRTDLEDAIRERSEVLCERIRSGAADSGPWREELVAHLRRTVADKLAVAKPPAANRR